MTSNHADSHRAARQRAAATLAVLGAAALLAGCGGSDSSAKQETTTATAPAAVPAASGPQSFDYVNNGLEATLSIDGETGTLTLRNGRDERVATPALYALDGLTGTRTDAALADAAPIPAGATVRLAVRFPKGTNTAAAGFFGLEFGGEDAGGFDGP